MEIFNTLKVNKNLSVALGFFDGVHFAHRELLKKTVSLAKENGLKSAVLTFLDSPQSIINKTPAFYITTLKKKAELIEKIGVDYFFAIDFNEIKNMEPNQYIEEILIKYFSPKYVITGFNHTFGKGGRGNIELLEKRKEFENIALEPVKINNTLVSSTNIRNFIKEGDFYFANELLSRPFSIEGEVIKGAQIARTLGKPTANIIWDENIVKPPYGVYFGAVLTEGKRLPSIINFGIRPTIDKKLKETLEAHIMGFEGNLYGKKIEVEFLKKMRDEKKFDSIEALKQKIEADYAEALLISGFYF